MKKADCSASGLAVGEPRSLRVGLPGQRKHSDQFCIRWPEVRDSGGSSINSYSIIEL
jgi:hypothetical protein